MMVDGRDEVMEGICRRDIEQMTGVVGEVNRNGEASVPRDIFYELTSFYLKEPIKNIFFESVNKQDWHFTDYLLRRKMVVGMGYDLRESDDLMLYHLRELKRNDLIKKLEEVKDGS